METLNLPIELQTLLTNLLASSHCSCHFINPKKTRIILWKEIKDNQEIYHLRIGLQRFTSLDCLDRNGEVYWKFEIPEVKKDNQIPTEYGKSNSESTVNNESTQSAS